MTQEHSRQTESEEHAAPSEKNSAVSHDPDTAVARASLPGPEATANGVTEKLFQASSKVGLALPAVLLAAQVWYGFVGTALYSPLEAEYILLYKQLSTSGQWLVTSFGDSAYWPVFVWFLAGLAKVLAHFAMPQNLLFPAAAALSTFLALCGVYSLSRAAGFGAQAALAACLILLCSPFFALLSHALTADALGAALLLCSLACFCNGLQKERAWIALPLAFALAALAGLTGGGFYALLPLLTSLIFLVWTGTFRHRHAPDVLFGFALFLLCVAVWLGCLILFTHSDTYVQSLCNTLLIFPLRPPAHWWLSFAFTGVGLLPWLMLVLCVSWNRVLLSAVRDLKASRGERAGSSFVWIALGIGYGLSLIAPESTGKVDFFPICLAALLLGKALLNLSKLGIRIFCALLALCLLCAGSALIAAGFDVSLNYMTNFLPFPITYELRDSIGALTSLPIFGAIFLVAALVFMTFRQSGPGGTLLVCALLAIALAQPAMLRLAPELRKTIVSLKPADAVTLPQSVAPAQNDEPADKDESAGKDEPANPVPPFTPTPVVPETEPAPTPPFALPETDSATPSAPIP
ncbi:MAG: glycosyltransferase family 39 protein [Desulfovibrio sp.]|jgi:4-amino-4-deoxy-L-arabinose transferase-like glycosyltransferase|nr:glycosyltransferase family 39 protein [Desulfovibrio sp.]